MKPKLKQTTDVIFTHHFKFFNTDLFLIVDLNKSNENNGQN